MKTTLHSSTVRASIVGSLFAAALVFGIPVSAYAATYAYVNTSGTLTYIEASSSEDALARATNRHAGSGVMLVTSTPITTPSQPVQLSGYVYVNTAGQVVRISATSATQAFAGAVNIAPNSGVMPIDSVADSNMVGDHVSGS